MSRMALDIKIKERMHIIKKAYRDRQLTNHNIITLIFMPDIYGINYNGVQPRPTFEALIKCVDYPIQYPDRTATCLRDLPLLTQF